ncbi:MAG TPA: PIN domain nuclease [Ilumatobacteraceae bacterium]|nr:PIN domain nuclease [Ilumatobacteraceae bacterium]
MAALAQYLADKSALARLHLSEVNVAVAPLIEAGLIATCAVTEFEVLWSTRSPGEYDTVATDRAVGYEWLATEDIDWRRALEVQRQLWATGRMRTVPLPDLLIAAVAERHRVTVLHYDSDYDTIADVTGQPTRWVVSRGSVA